MHVAVDGVGNHVGGGWSVLARTVSRIAEDPRVERLTVFCSPLDLVASPAPHHPKIQWVEHGREHRSPRARLAWFSIGLDSEVDRVEADVVLSMNGVGRTTRPRVCLVQQAFTVWGSLMRVRPRRFAARLAVLRRQTAKSVLAAEAVVVQTTWMRRQVWDCFQRHAEVLPLGLPAAHRVRAERDPTRAAFVGSDLPYKRRDVAHAAIELARRQLPAVELTVVDDVTPARVRELLGQVGVLLVTSDVESFGLPIVEAFAAHCPVVLTELDWARSVADNAAAYFDHGAAPSAARRIVEAIGEPARLADLARRGDERLAQMWDDEPYRRLVNLLVEVA